MKRLIFLMTFGLFTAFIFGCAKPDQIRVLKTPINGLSFTEEVSKGLGPATGDDTSVYAHLDRDGKSRKIRVLSGENVTVNQVLWTSSNEAIICIRAGGITDEFRNNVTLILSDTQDLKIHLVLREDC